MNLDFARFLFYVVRLVGWAAIGLSVLFALFAATDNGPGVSAAQWFGAALSSLGIVTVGTIGAALIECTAKLQHISALLTAEAHKTNMERIHRKDANQG